MVHGSWFMDFLAYEQFVVHSRKKQLDFSSNKAFHYQPPENQQPSAMNYEP